MSFLEQERLNGETRAVLSSLALQVFLSASFGELFVFVVCPRRSFLGHTSFLEHTFFCLMFVAPKSHNQELFIIVTTSKK